MNALLVRHAYLPAVTLGWMLVGKLRLATLEEPWRADPDGPGGQKREGSQMESCVPDGMYNLRPHSGTKWQNTWALENHALGIYHLPSQIPAGQKYGRSAILIHSGTTVRSIMGCILVGLAHGKLGGLDCVEGSMVALEQLRSELAPRVTHTLTIRATAGTAEAA